MKKLYRDRSGKMVAGVCSGLAQYLDVDPVLVRVGFILGTFANGIGLIAYVVLWVLVPQRPFAHDLYPEAQTAAFKDDNGPRQFSPAVIFGAILIAVGTLAFLENIIPHFDLSELWPLILIALGIGLVVRNVRMSRTVDSSATEQAEPRSSL